MPPSYIFQFTHAIAADKRGDELFLDDFETRRRPFLAVVSFQHSGGDLPVPILKIVCRKLDFWLSWPSEIHAIVEIYTDRNAVLGPRITQIGAISITYHIERRITWLTKAALDWRGARELWREYSDMSVDKPLAYARSQPPSAARGP